MGRQELIERLRQLDEITLLELLEVNSDMLVDAFANEIEEHEGRIRRYINDE